MDPRGKSNLKARRSTRSPNTLELDELEDEADRADNQICQTSSVAGQLRQDAQIRHFGSWSESASHEDAETNHNARNMCGEVETAAKTDSNYSGNHAQLRSAMIARLKEERGVHMRKCQDLETTINEKELACGRMLQQVLDNETRVERIKQEMQRLQKLIDEEAIAAERLKGAIRLKRRHMAEDRDRQADELRLQEEKTHELLNLIDDM